MPKNYGLIRKPRKVSRRPAEPEAKGRRADIGLAIASVLLLVVLIAVVIKTLSGSKRPTAIPAESALAAYRLVYRVVTPGAPDHEEERDILRPFDGRYLERNSTGVTAGILTTTEGAFAWTASGPKPGWIPAEGGLNRATADQHAAAALAAGQRSGLARIVGTRRLLGRPCVEMRTASPLGQPLAKPTSANHTDVCVDRTGVILDEEWTRDKQLVRTRMAVRFDVEPAFDPGTFRPEPVSGAGLSQSTTVATVHAASAAEVAHLGFIFTAPPGYTAAGPVTARVSAGNGVPSVAEFVQYFSRGADLLAVIQGDNGVPAGVPVAIPGGDRAYLSLDMTASTIEKIDEGGRYVKVEGADVNLLFAAASGLRAAASG